MQDICTVLDASWMRCTHDTRSQVCTESRDTSRITRYLEILDKHAKS